MTETDHCARLADLYEDVWQRLGRGVADRRAPARHPVLATVGEARPGGTRDPDQGGFAGEARIVVLREADKALGRLTIHTDEASGKVAEIRALPWATLLVWDVRARVQIRLRCRIGIRSGTQAEWARVPDPSRRAYGGAPPPGTPISAPDEYVPDADPARFTVLEADIAEIELLHLGQEQHLRAVFRRTDGWRGAWLAP
ncbi:MAG: pyridoxamine 5'-phosphate oxidase [Pseudomonadota bacterium]